MGDPGPAAAVAGVDPPGGRLHLDFPAELNDYDEPLRWIVTWLHLESEGSIVAQGKGPGLAEAPIPTNAVGYRIRRWYSDGVAPEYDDQLFADMRTTAVP